MLKLTHDNYFSEEAEMAYMSYSQFKAFEMCPEAAVKAEKEQKDYFTEGHFFEAVIDGEGGDFVEAHPEMLTRTGELRENYRRTIDAAIAIKEQPLLRRILSRCERQVILTGEIAGVPYKGCVDLLDPETGDTYDTKYVKDFRRVWSDVENTRLEWYFAYGYHYQAAIYRELVRQNLGKVGSQYIIAATKEKVPEIGFYQFTADIIDNALGIVEYMSPRYREMKDGKRDLPRCGVCDHCKKTKLITEPVLIDEFR